MRWKTTTRTTIEVQFEDIDGGGVVHHPNYLKYLERARCQAMREIGVPFEECLRNGIAFVVAEFSGRYLAPLKFGSRIVVETRLVAVRKSSLKVFQKIVTTESDATSAKDDKAFLQADRNTHFIAQLRLVAVDLASGKPMSVPDDLRLASGVPDAAVLAEEPSCSDVRLRAFEDL